MAYTHSECFAQSFLNEWPVISFESKLPISRDEFEKSRKIESLEQAIIAFLKANGQNAYSAREIFAEMFQRAFSPNELKDVEEIARVERVLETLMGKKSVLAGATGFPEEIYYIVP